jgi:hypothetical protein
VATRRLSPCGSLLLVLVAATLPAAAQQTAELEARIGELRQQVTALEKEHFQQSQTITKNQENLDRDTPLAAVGQHWVNAAGGFLSRIEEKQRAYDEANARFNEIPPEDRSWLDHICLGFIKAPQRRIPRAASLLYDRINARWDLLLFHRTIQDELAEGIRVGDDPRLHKFGSVADFVRRAQAEILKSALVEDNCKTWRDNIARAERRQAEIDAEKQRLRSELHELERRLAELREQAANQPTPPARPAPNLAEPEIVEAMCSQLDGAAGSRVAVWRFYVRLNVRNHVPVQLRLDELTREPEMQDPDPKRRFVPPQRMFTVRPGDTFQLSGWEDPETGVPILEEMATGDLPRVPSVRDLGPYYLTVWEANGFQGRFRATFSTVAGAPAPVQLVAEFSPPPPATSQVQMRVDDPDEDERSGPADAMMSSFAWKDTYHLRIAVYVPDLSPGLYRLRVQVRGQPDRFLWGLAKDGEAQTSIWGFVPLNVGPYQMTLSVPEAPQVAPVTISGRLDPARGTVDALVSARDRVQKAQAALSDSSSRAAPELRRWLLGDAQVLYAQKLNLAGRFEEALQVSEQAIRNLPECKVGATYPKGKGSEYQDTAWKEKATALYHLFQRDAYREAMEHICQTQLRMAREFRQSGSDAVAKDYLQRAGEYRHLLAHRLMLLGVDLTEVRREVEVGNQLYQQAGKNVPKLVWYPQ